LESWRLALGDQGRNLVVKYIDQIVTYLIEQMESDNFGVREGSSRCMGELATRFYNFQLKF